MKQTLHPNRQAALTKYNEAHKAWIASTNQKDESVYLAADAALEDARRKLVDAEKNYPTLKEEIRRHNAISRSNRGLD